MSPKMELLQLLCTIMCLVHASMAAFGPKRLYSMDLPTTPVSVRVVGRDLIIVGPWYIGSITNINWKFRQSSRMKPRVINKDIPNPRSVGKIPSNAFKSSKALTYWVASWGVNETSGAMYVMRPTTTYSIWKDIAIDAGWNYERAQWVDMNRDGRMDCLTARYRGGVGQLLWFQQPAGQDKWGQQIIHEGMADGNFIGFVKGRKTYILVAGLQFSTLGLYWTMSRSNLWSTSRMVRHRVVDNYGKFYDVQYVDLNRDGRPDCLTTTVNVGNSRGHVLGYEIPDDIQNKIWKRRVLAAGFEGDYSPGKAMAFWPNKWKRKTDRPSVFLSGAGQESLFILTPKPARSGWGYVKSSLKAGSGMIGLPYIGDIDGDSYPEVFVPQGNKLHVFSYDYNAAVAEPPNAKSNAGKVTPRPVVKYVPPFFRPTPATLPPLIPRNASRNGLLPNAGGLSGAAASQFGASGVLPSGGASSATVAPLGNLPPIRTRGGSTGSNPRVPSPNLPATVPRTNPLAPASGWGGGGVGNSGGSANNNFGASAGAGGSSDSANNFGASTGGAGATGGLGSQNSPYIVTNNGQVYVPLPNQPSSQGNPSGGARIGPAANNPVAPVPQNNPVRNGAANNPIVPIAPNNPIVPIGGGSSVFNPNQGSSGQNIIPIGGQSSAENEQSDNPIVPIGGGISRTPMEPVFEDEMYPSEGEYYYPDDEEYYDEFYYQTAMETPANPILSLTSDSHKYREEAEAACTFENKMLCSLSQLESAKSAGPIPLIEWGWFGIENRAAGIHDCVPGEIKWQGYKCHNGVIGHLPVHQSTAMKGYCCSVLRGANITDRRFSNLQAATEGCKQINAHICSLEELYDVWEKSSYKSSVWGWYNDAKKLIKMVHHCDSRQIKWPGYECHSRKLETSEIVGFVQESAYCCQENSGRKIMTQFNLIFIGFFLTFF